MRASGEEKTVTARNEGPELPSYSRWDGDLLVTQDGEQASRHAQDVHAAFLALLREPDFPCVGAKSVINQKSYRFGLYDELASPDSTIRLAGDLLRFIDERPALDGEFNSYVASFVRPKIMTVDEFEALLWRQLEGLHQLIREKFAWNPVVSADPRSPEFSFSFGGEAFFVVGLSPASPRWARRFPWPTLVFNDHFQFERLRAEERFDRIREVIRERDLSLHGTTNPMLADYGRHSEARQYSGRQSEDAWECPVHFDAR